MQSLVKEIVVAARESKLSKAQVHEVFCLLQNMEVKVFFKNLWIQTMGDLDQNVSLKLMEKTDFFTREIDQALLSGSCDIAIHSAKDLPDPLHQDLQIVALTKGVDSSDVLVLREGETVENLAIGAKIGTSSLRREKNIKAFRDDLVCVDIRGTIEQRLVQLDRGDFDGLVMANAALIRLNLERNVFFFPGDPSPMQGRLAIISRRGDFEMERIFSGLHDG